MRGRFILKLILELIGRDRAGVRGVPAQPHMGTRRSPQDFVGDPRARQAPAEAELAAAVRAELERRTKP